MTYTKLLWLPEDDLMALGPETIILDEFHRCGAYCWGAGCGTAAAGIFRCEGAGLIGDPDPYYY